MASKIDPALVLRHREMLLRGLPKGSTVYAIVKKTKTGVKIGAQYFRVTELRDIENITPEVSSVCGNRWDYITGFMPVQSPDEAIVLLGRRLHNDINAYKYKEL